MSTRTVIVIAVSVTLFVVLFGLQLNTARSDDPVEWANTVPALVPCPESVSQCNMTGCSGPGGSCLIITSCHEEVRLNGNFDKVTGVGTTEIGPDAACRRLYQCRRSGPMDVCIRDAELPASPSMRWTYKVK